MRIRARSFATLALLLSAITCADQSTAPRIGTVTVDPDLSTTASAIALRMAEFGITVDKARFILIRGGADTILNSSVDIDATSGLAARDFSVTENNGDEIFTANVVLSGPAGEIYRGSGLAKAEAKRIIILDYVGPGATAAAITVSPATSALSGVSTSALTVSALTATGAPVTTPVKWTTSDATVATISASGVVQSTGKRGSVTIGAETPTFISADAVVNVTPSATAITLESGGSQSGRYGTSLLVPTVVRAIAADGLGVAGVTVTFAAPNGGSVSPATAVTDVNGRASTTITLGNVAGAQTFTAASGNLGVAIPETANAGPAATIAATQGNSQSATVLSALPTLLSVTVTDAAGNVVPGAVVSWTRAGTGVIRDATVITNAAGVAANLYTLGSVAGSETITASTAGVSAAATFTATATPDAPAAIAKTLGDAQTPAIQSALTELLTISVTDASGNPAPGVTVNWTRIGSGSLTSATTTTTSAGIATNSYVTGSIVGAETVTAAVAGVATAVTFTITVKPGAAASLAFTTTPSTGTSGQAISPVIVTVRDAGGNTVPVAIPVTIAMTAGSGPTGAALSGTTTRTTIAGIATFNDLSLNKAGTTYSLTATSSGVSAGASSAIVIGPGTAATITTIAGAAQTALVNNNVAIPPSVKVVDANGNVVAGASVVFAASGGGSVLPATPVATDANGIATLTSWKLGTLAGAQSLAATIPGGGSGVTIQATALAQAPAALLLVTQPSPTVETGFALTVQPVVKLVDQFGNVSPASGVIITATPSAGTATGNSVAVASATGVATFTNLALTATGSVTLQFSTNAALPELTSNAVVVNPPPIAGLALGGIPSTATNNAQFGSVQTVQLLDGASNPLARGNIVVTMAAVAASGGSATPPTLLVGTATTIAATTDANGLATFSGVRPLGLVQNFALSFAAVVGPTVTSPAIALGAGAAMKVGIVSGDGQTGLIGTALPVAVRAQVLDTLGQATTAPATVSFTPAGGGSASAPVTASGGFADATWTLGSTEGANTLTASVVGSTFGAATFSATASDIHAMALIQSPSTTITNGVVAAAQPTVQLRALNGTNLPKAGVTVTATATLTDGTTAAPQTLSGTTAISDANGLATFTNLKLLGLGVGDILLKFDVTAGTTQAIPTQSVRVTIVAGAPTVASLGSSRVVLKDTPTLAANLRPAVQFRDVSGNPAANASGVSATFTVTAGACTINNGSAIAVDALGQSKIPDASLTIPSTAARSCRVHATTSPALSGSFDFDIVVPAATGVAWLGGTSNVFSVASNWSGAVAPALTDAVFIPSSTPNAPQMQAGASIGSLAMETGSTLSVGTGNTLTVAGSVDATTVTNGTLTATGTSSTARGTFTSVALTFGDGTSSCSYTLNGTATATAGTPATSGNVAVANCSVDVANQTLAIGRDLSVTGTNGKLVMQNSTGKVTVAGNATFNGASTGAALTAGTLEVAGNFQQLSSVSSSSFTPSLGHTTKLTGAAGQSVNFANPTTSHFYNLDVTNASTSGATITSVVEVANNLTVSGSARLSGTSSGGGRRLTVAGAVSAGISSDLGGLDSLQITGTTFPAFANITAGKAPHMTVLTNNGVAMTGHITVAGGLGIKGTLDIGQYTLTIKDSLIVPGTLNMTVPSGKVTVGGLARFNGATSAGHLVAGLLQVAGNFIEEGSISTSFAPSSGFLVQLNGSSSQSVSFDHPGSASSRFANLDINNTSSSGVTFSSDIRVTGDLQQKGVLGVGSGRTATVDGTSSFVVGAKTTITGTLQLAPADFYNGSQTTGAGTLAVSGTCRYGSTLGPLDLFVGSTFNLTNCSRIGLP